MTLLSVLALNVTSAIADAFTIANGAQPSVAVDQEGTAHVVWNQVTSDTQADVLHYCQVPRGATSCQHEQTFVPPERDPQYNKEFARARVVLPGPDQVEILTSRYPDPVTVDPTGNPSNPLCAGVISDDTGFCFDSDSNTWAWRSQDDGVTFGTPMVFSHAAPGGDVAVFNTPTPVIGSVTETTTGGTFFASAAPGGYDRSAINLGDGGPDRAYYGTLAALNDGIPIAGFADLNSNIFVRTHIGSDPSTFNDLLTWRQPVTLRGDEPRLAGGPGGVYMSYRPYANGGATQPYSVRSFKGNRFLKPIIKLTTDPGDQYGDLFEDDSGRLHAAWVHHAIGGDQLTYRFSTDHRNFFSPQVIASGADGQIQNVSLSSADDGGGFAVYSSAFSGNSTIRLAPFGTAEKRTLIDVGIAGMDVTQGIQKTDFAIRGSDLSTRAVLPYTGVDLADFGKTVVRVYATSRRPLSGAAVPPMQLFGFHNGNALGGGALLPDALPTSLPVGPPNLITPAERTSTTLVYTFTLPWQWARGDVNLVAQINPGNLLPVIAECRLCRTDNSFELDGIHFKPTVRVRLLPVAITTNGEQPNGYPDPGPVFNGARATTPLPFDIPGYLGTLDMTDLANATQVKVESCFLGIWPCSTSTRAITQSERLGFALNRLSDWASDHSSSVYPIGVFRDDSKLGGVTNAGAQLFGGTQPQSIVRDDRPLTSAAHEIGHGLGRVHAGLTCGSNGGGQVGEAWPPNNDGALDGIGLDTRVPSPYSVISSTAPGAPPTYFDLMSYCANTNESTAGGNLPDAWVSLRNWQRDLTTAGPFTNAARAAAVGAASTGASAPRPSRRVAIARIASAHPASARSLRVVAVVPVDGPAAVVEVAPDDGAPTPVDANQSYQLVARGAGGKILSTSGAVPQVEHTEHGLPVLLLSGRVPAAGVKGIEVMSGTKPITAQLGSAHAPTVKILAPKAGATLGRSGQAVTIRWRAADADPQTKLTAIVQYSTDDGRTFRTLWIGADRRSLQLPARLFVGSRRARVRVRVQDDFHEALATSGRFTAASAPPLVRTVSPAAGSTFRAGAPVALAGEAFDQTGRALNGRALTWSSGATVLGHGRLIVAAGLAPGRRRLTLTARGPAGGMARAGLVVRITPARPLFTVLRAPRHVGAKTKSVVLTVAATFTTPLTAGRLHVTVGRTPSRVRIPIKRGRSGLQLTLKLGSGRLVSRQTVLIARG
ncbi:MAG TPA: hypothetical protein VHW04_06485 [Solirubrobacteraceae bacterium]|nr:hypothetical protein [Solirubrobacteraceae bacterium]